MSNDFDAKSSFKRDITHVFDAVNSYLLIKNRGKIKKRIIKIYTGYNTSTGSMGHSSIVQEGIIHTYLVKKKTFSNLFNVVSN